MTNDPPTEHVVKVAYTEELVRSAAGLYWKKGIGNSGLISLGVIVVSCLAMMFLGVESWVVSFFAGVGVINFAMVAATYFSIRNTGLSRFRKMDDKTATFTFSEKGIAIEADSGRSEIPWKMIEKVIQYPQFWLFSIAKSSYFTLPIASVPPETREFILTHFPETK